MSTDKKDRDHGEEMKNQIGPVKAQSVFVEEDIVGDHENGNEGTVKLGGGAVQPGAVKVAPDKLVIDYGVLEPDQMDKVITGKKIEEHRPVTGYRNQHSQSQQYSGRSYIGLFSFIDIGLSHTRTSVLHPCFAVEQRRLLHLELLEQKR